jgi:hypothetical protein
MMMNGKLVNVQKRKKRRKKKLDAEEMDGLFAVVDHRSENQFATRKE